MNFMDLAIEEAKKAKGEIPVGAVIVKEGKIIAKAYNTVEKDNDVTSHAEIKAIQIAQKHLNSRRLENCEIYVTLEPCPMCGWAIIQARIKSVYFGSYDTNYGAFTSGIDLKAIANSKINIYGGQKEMECNNILRVFFKEIRENH